MTCLQVTAITQLWICGQRNGMVSLHTLAFGSRPERGLLQPSFEVLSIVWQFGDSFQPEWGLLMNLALVTVPSRRVLK